MITKSYLWLYRGCVKDLMLKQKLLSKYILFNLSVKEKYILLTLKTCFFREKIVPLQ